MLQTGTEVLRSDKELTELVGIGERRRSRPAGSARMVVELNGTGLKK
jgi:hypothetical protein